MVKKTILILCAAWMLISCDNQATNAFQPFRDLPDSILTPKANEQIISKGTFDGVWPLAYDSGLLGCIDHAVYFTAGNITYALDKSSNAYSSDKDLGWAPVNIDSIIWLPTLSPSENEVGLDDFVKTGERLCH